MASDFAGYFKNWSARMVMLATLSVVIVAVGFWLLFRFYSVVLLLFVAIVLGTAVKPAVVWLGRRGVPRLYGELLIYLLLLILVVAFLVLTLPLIVEQASAVGRQLASYYSDFRWFMLNSRSQLLQRLGIRLPSQFQVQNVVPSAPAQDQAASGDEVAQTVDRVAQAFEFAGMAARGLFAMIAVFIMSFYWTLEGNRAMRAITLLVPQSRRESAREVWTSIETKVGGFLLGQITLCVIIGLMQLIAYTLIGLPNALILALIAGVTEAIPIVGPALGALPAVLITISNNPSDVIWVLISTAIIQGLENGLLVPRIMGRSVGLNPLLTLLALAAFSSLWGVAGALLAIPIAATLQLLAQRLVFEREPVLQEDIDQRDYMSVLRMKAQEIAQDSRKQWRERTDEQEEELNLETWVEDEIETLANELDHLLEQAGQRERKHT